MRKLRLTETAVKNHEELITKNTKALREYGFGSERGLLSPFPLSCPSGQPPAEEREIEQRVR
jgi:hypothetical protein